MPRTVLGRLFAWNYHHYGYLLIILAVVTQSFAQSLMPPEELLFPPDAIHRYMHTQPGSFFGYSVASFVGQSQPFCLVGAPRALYDPFGEAQPDAPTTGLVYRIDLDPAHPDCSIVPIATTDEMRREHGTPTPGYSSWLGGTVAAAANSLDGVQLGCDPRYVYAPKPMNRTEDSAGANRMAVQQRTLLGTGHCALYTGASMRYTSVDACSSQEEGACLAGFSASIQPGQQSGEAMVALGMPGSYLTEGNVFLGQYRGLQLINAMRLKSSPTDLKNRGFNLGYAIVLDRLLRRPVNQSSSSSSSTPVPVVQDMWHGWSLLTSSSVWKDNDYLGVVMILDQALDLGGITYLKDQWGHIGSFFGYSLATADLDGNGVADIIVGAPYYTQRKQTEDSSTTDETTTHLKSTSSSQSNDPNKPHQSPLSTTESTTTTTSHDKPTESKTPKETWGGLIPDIGRVYVFYGYVLASKTDVNQIMNGNPSEPNFLSRPPVILNGPRIAGGRFGHVVESLGDVDGDGTEDLAVACPYCTDPEGRPDKGAVFVYLGKKDDVLMDEPMQIIRPGDVPNATPQTTCGDLTMESPSPRPFQSFGWSLSAGADLDGNFAPDLVVGDFDSDQVVMIRARNTLWFDSAEWTLPQRRTLPWIGPEHTPCGPECQFRIQLSVAVHGKSGLFHHRMTKFKLHVMIDLDASMENLVFKRVIGHDLSDPQSSERLQPHNGILETIVPITVQVDPKTGLNRLNLLSLLVEPHADRVRAFLWKPLIINATITPVLDAMPHVEGPTKVPQWTLHPFLGERYFASRPMQFANPTCGSDNICHADLQVRMFDLSEGPLDYLVVYFRERITDRNLTVSVANLGENAYAAKLRITIPHQFSFTVPEDLLCQFKLLHDVSATQLLCDLGDPLGHTMDTSKQFLFQLNTAGAFRELDEPLNDQPHPEPNWTTTAEPPSPAKEIKWMHNSQLEANRLSKRDLQNKNTGPTAMPKTGASVLRDSVSIIAEVISGNEDSDMSNNRAVITYKLQLAAKIELSSSSMDRTTIDARNFTVQLNKMQRVHPETLGPEITHIYLVTNGGPSPMEQLWVNISMPMQTRDGEHLVYFLDRVRYKAEDGGPPMMVNRAPEVISAEGHVRGICLTPEWALNPLRLNAVHRGGGLSGQSMTRNQTSSESDGKRTRRSVPDHNTSSQVLVESSSSVRTTRSILSGVRKRQQEIIKCGQEFSDLGEPICVTVPCRIDHLSRGDAVRIVLRGHVWADTFFRHQISDLAIVSEAYSELAPIAFGIPVHGNRTIPTLAISQNFVFHGIQINPFREIPRWPIVLGLLLGLGLLVLIIYGMWRCGFFRRRRWYDNANGSAMAVVPTDL